LLLRINNKTKKSVDVLDLFSEVDYLSQDNKFVFNDGVIHATLKKKNAGHIWPQLLIDNISLVELKTRRK
jgi:hypothetical protein